MHPALAEFKDVIKSFRRNSSQMFYRHPQSSRVSQIGTKIGICRILSVKDVPCWDDSIEHPPGKYLIIFPGMIFLQCDTLLPLIPISAALLARAVPRTVVSGQWILSQALLTPAHKCFRCCQSRTSFPPRQRARRDRE